MEANCSAKCLSNQTSTSYKKDVMIFRQPSVAVSRCNYTNYLAEAPMSGLNSDSLHIFGPQAPFFYLIRECFEWHGARGISQEQMAGIKC